MLEHLCRKPSSKPSIELWVQLISTFWGYEFSSPRGPRGLPFPEGKIFLKYQLFIRDQGTAPSSSRELCAKPDYGSHCNTNSWTVHILGRNQMQRYRRYHHLVDFDPCWPIWRCPSWCETKVLILLSSSSSIIISIIIIIMMFMPSHPHQTISKI